MEERRYELTSSEWNRIKRMLPPEHPKSGQRGRPAKYDNRRINNGILARSEALWRELSERYGKWQAVFTRFRLWKQRGIFEAIFAVLSAGCRYRYGEYLYRLHVLQRTSKCQRQEEKPGREKRFKRLSRPQAAGIRKFTR